MIACRDYCALQGKYTTNPMLAPHVPCITSSQEMAPTIKTNAGRGEVPAEPGSTDNCRLRTVTGLILIVQQEGGNEMR